MSHISGIATVKLINLLNWLIKSVKICCTRKTIPTLRVIQKYAVKARWGY